MTPNSALLSEALAAFRRPPALTISEWADKYRVLSPESSNEPGRWSTARAEYQRGIMDCITDPLVDRVVLMTSAQVGKSECINCALGYFIDYMPCPILLLQPTLQMAEAYSKDRIAPMLRDTPRLAGKVADVAARDGGNTLLHKQFPGGHLTLAGANSPASLASRPIRIVMADEVDRYPPSAGTEGDPLSLAEKRTATFWGRKILIASTPTVKDFSRIERAFKNSDQRRYFVPCPHCGESQILEWRQVVWPDKEPLKAAYVCPHCAVAWSEAVRAEAVRQGEWRATAAFNGTAGFHLNELYSPWRTLGAIATDFLAAKGHPEMLKQWVNSCLGEVWEEAGESVEVSDLQRRAERYSLGTVPDGALVLTSGIDIQGDRLELLSVGWGDGMESWIIDRQIFFGDPASALVWDQLAEHLAVPLTADNGALVIPRAVAIDSGYLSQDVYNFVRHNAVRRGEFGLQLVLAIKGISAWTAPALGKPTDQDIDYRGDRVERGVKLWPIGTSTIKQSLYAWLRITTPGPHHVHFSDELPPEFYDQLTSEKLQTRYRFGHPFREWHLPGGRRNEALDCFVYAYAAACRMQLHLFRPAQWDARRKELASLARAGGKPAQDQSHAATDPPAAVPVPPPPPPQPAQGRNPFDRLPGGGNWTTGWRR